LGKREFAKKR
ncbi:hypothetical protein D030_1179B, partial [Vibrio parahaemolyticus AQ3810]